jgi:GDPmannose 4,6-dehydratase
MPTALITGIRGQDGRLLAASLRARGWTVHGTARSEDAGEDPTGAIVHAAELERPDVVADLIRALVPDLVVNLAAMSSVAQSWRQPELAAAVNGRAVEVLLAACLEAEDASLRPVRFVQASSSEIFGDAEAGLQDEDTPIRPRNPYGVAKAVAHRAVEAHRALGRFGANAILFNHESVDRPADFVTRRITLGVAAIARGEQDLLVLGDLSPRRDWSWAPDVVHAIELIADAEIPDDFVVASGRAHSVAEFVAAAFTVAGIDDWRSRIVQDPSLLRAADPGVSVGDASRIRQRLGWAPTVGFEGIVRRMVEHDLARHPVPA